jgi:hypothetical protein
MQKSKNPLIKFILSLILSIGFMITTASVAHAATINVNTTTDTVSGPQCSLRSAIIASNTDTASGGCIAGSGLDTINLPAGTYDMTIDGVGEDASATGDFDITRNVNIVGVSASSTIINGNHLDRIFHINITSGGSGESTNFSNLTIQKGTVNSPTGVGNGGGFYISSVNPVNISTSIIEMNSALGDEPNGYGGGIYVTSPTPNLNLNSVILRGNFAKHGAALGVIETTTTYSIRNSTITNNNALHAGAAIFADSTVGVTSGDIVNSTISGNKTTYTFEGAAFYQYRNSILNLLNDTVYDNNSFDNTNGMQYLNSSTSSIRFKNTIFANKGFRTCNAGLGVIVSNGNNLDSSNTCGFASTGDIQNRDPLVFPLAAYGGFTPTHALAPNSPAIDAGSGPVAGIPTTDQRGITRPQGYAYDIGAYEYVFTADIKVDKYHTPTTVNAGGNVTYTITVNNLGPDNGIKNIVVTDNFPSTLSNINWTCKVVSGTGSCAAASGTGNINTTLTLDSSAAAVFTVTATVPNSSASISNTITANAPAIIIDPDSTNNSATDTFTPVDTLAPIITQVTAIPSLTNDNTPNYTFSSDEAGTILYGGSCNSSTNTATLGNNTITFNTLADANYANCTVRVQDASGNLSNILTLASFTIDTTAPVLAQTSAIPTWTNDTTSEYGFSSTEAGSITYGGPCISSTTSAVNGNNTVTFNTLAQGQYSNCTVRVSDAAGNLSNVLTVPTFNIDTVSPTLTQVTAIPTLTTDNTPNYVFTSTEAGIIVYTGSCSSTTTNAVSGNNIITLNTLNDGTYSNCTIREQDPAGNLSNILAIPVFTIDTTAPILTTISTVPANTTETTPIFTFSSSEAGTITYTGDCVSSTTNAIQGINMIKFNRLNTGTHSNCTVKVTDSAGHVSNTLIISPFTIAEVLGASISTTPTPTLVNTGQTTTTVSIVVGIVMIIILAGINITRSEFIRSKFKF